MTLKNIFRLTKVIRFLSLCSVGFFIFILVIYPGMLVSKEYGFKYGILLIIFLSLIYYANWRYDRDSGIKN